MTPNPTARTGKLFVALELSKSKWLLAMSNGEKIRQVQIAAGDEKALVTALTLGRQKLGLSPQCAVRSCYEAGRDGFWIARLLQKLGIENLVVDAASIEVNRRLRRAKTDRLDAARLVRMLMRWVAGETTLWRVVRVPEAAQEDERRLHRERERLKKERGAHRARVLSLLALHGVRAKFRGAKLPPVETLRTWEGQPLPVALAAELEREGLRLALVEEQLKELERQQQAALAKPQTAAQKKAAALARLRGVGGVSAWLLACECFGWRQFANRREVGAMAGLTGTPYDSGQSVREQGISKAGNKRVRWLAIELAWAWLRFQPDSQLSRWWRERFGSGSSRQRRVGIVALARKLLVALWKYVERGEVPEGALLKAA